MRVRIRKTLRRAAVLGLAAAALGAASPASGPDPATTPAAEAGAGHVVLVELFTSQGCSTCPPADRLLTSLAEESAGRVVTLAFHVDFWNSAGWTDPFSAKSWTERQVAYGRRFGLTEIYTPQAVVDGGVELVGSDATRLRAAIQAAAARPGGQIAFDLKPSGSRVEVGIGVTLPESLRGQALDLYVAVFETGLVTAVGRGENGGRTLHDDYVVRSLERVGRVPVSGSLQTRQSASVTLSKDWNPARLGVAVFLQDPKTLEVRGASAKPLAAPAPG